MMEQEKVGLHPAGEHSAQSEYGKANKAPEGNKSEQQTPSDSDADSSDSSSAPSFIELALQGNACMDFKLKKSLHFVVPLKVPTDDAQGHGCSDKAETSTRKPFALPLRMPPVAISPLAHEDRNKTKGPLDGNNPAKGRLAPVSVMLGPPSSPRFKRRPSTDSMAIASSPQPRRHCKSAKPVDEPKYGDTFPLETAEHEWMVKSALGHWSLVYGLLLNDAHLAEKKDFMSGFTALHWAAKCGKDDMVCKIIDLSRQDGKGVDVNTKSYAGYTPLHVAAIHGQEYVIGLLVQEYGANCNVRDNSGKKPHHYLHKDASPGIRELLGGLKVVRVEQQKNTEDGDTRKHIHTIGRLFQPQTIGYKKKPKSRSTFLSMAENTTPMHRVLSDVFS